MKNDTYKIEENIEHRGNDKQVTTKLQLEMELIRNINLEEPIYSFDKEKSESS